MFPAVVSVLATSKQHRHLIPTEAETKHMEDLRTLLTPFEQATFMVSSEKKPTAGLILPIMAQFLNRDLKENLTDSTLIKKAKTAIREDLSQRYQCTEEQELLKIATILDPRFKGLSWMPDTDKDQVKSALHQETLQAAPLLEQHPHPLVTVVKQEPSDEDQPVPGLSQPQVSQLPAAAQLPQLPADLLQDSPTDTTPQTPQESDPELVQPTKKQKAVEESFFDDVIFVKEEHQISMEDKIQVEIDRYLQEAPCTLSGDPVSWWRDRIGSYPLLSQMAARYLMIPATSVPSERVFSAAGNICSKKRSALKPENVNMLLFLHKNYKL